MPVLAVDKKTDPSDEALMERVARGDRDAFQNLYDRHYRMIYNVAQRIVANRNDAEDLAQDAFLSAYRQASSFEGRSRFTTWLTSIVINKSINADNQRKNRTSILKRVFTKQDTAELELPKDEVEKLFATFTPRVRALLTLRYMQKFSYDQIAESLGCAVGTVKSRLSQAHEMIRQALAGKGVE